MSVRFHNSFQKCEFFMACLVAAGLLVVALKLIGDLQPEVVAFDAIIGLKFRQPARLDQQGLVTHG